MTSMSLRVCLDEECDELTTKTRCPKHERTRNARRTRGTTLQKLRRRVIQRDGGCVVCGSTEDLTVDYEGDHSKARLADTVTLCRSHHGQKDGAKARASF